MAEAQWYVIHTFSGYENKVKADIEKTVVNRNFQDLIFEVSVPMQDEIQIKNGVRKVVQKKKCPSYVFVNMILNEDTWYVVRNTHGVTGYVGPESKPVPLTEEEVANLALEESNIVVDYAVGDSVTVINGVWLGTVGVIKSINESKQTLTLLVDMFGRETPVELEFEDVRRM